LTLVGYLLIIDRKVAVSGDDREQPQLPVNKHRRILRIMRDYEWQSLGVQLENRR
jgi:hypothetical protein